MGTLVNEDRGYHESSEKILNQFLEKHFYNSINNSAYKRVECKETQVKGVDVVLNIDGKQYLIDEKCSIMWRNLDTFSLELSTYNRNHTKVFTGWFLNENLLTTHYLFIWINKTDVDEEDKHGKFKTNNKIKGIDSIKDIEVALISKKKIKEHFSTLGWNDYKLSKKAFNIRYNNDNRFGNLKSNGCKFSYTYGNPKMPEEPVNVLLHKKTYIELSDIYKHIVVE